MCLLLFFINKIKLLMIEEEPAGIHHITPYLIINVWRTNFKPDNNLKIMFW